MKRVLLFASIAIIFASCSSEPKFELEMNIHNNKSLQNKKLIINQSIDGSVVYSDTIKIGKDQFVLKIPYKGPALINVSIPESNVKDIMMVAEKGTIMLNIDGIIPHLSGTPINDRLQVFYLENDSVSLLFKQLEDEYELQYRANPQSIQIREDFRANRSQLLKENTNRIIAFIEENVDNPIGEYYFMNNYITFPPERQLELLGFATDKLKNMIR